MKNQQKILVILAHPDDETLVSGTLALCTKKGASVCLVSATDGGGGWAPGGISEKELSAIRRESLRKACATLGIQRLEFFEERSRLPFCLNGKNYTAVIDQHRQWVMDLIGDISPDAVITFGPEGLTGHATHIMVGSMTTQAVLLSQVQPHLYYSAFSRGQTTAILEWFKENSIVADHYAAEVRVKPNLGSELPQLFSVPDSVITTIIDISSVICLKQQAWRCHSTQGGGGRVLDAFGANLTESFVRVLPKMPPGTPIETEL